VDLVGHDNRDSGLLVVGSDDAYFGPLSQLGRHARLGDGVAGDDDNGNRHCHGTLLSSKKRLSPECDDAN
jgi:hypothetical protein